MYVQATDADIGLNAELRYSLIPGTEKLTFRNNKTSKKLLKLLRRLCLLFRRTKASVKWNIQALLREFYLDVKIYRSGLRESGSNFALVTDWQRAIGEWLFVT